MGRIPYTVWVDKAVFKVHKSTVSKILTTVTAVLVIRLGYNQVISYWFYYPFSHQEKSEKYL
jgi:hypothetical protein